MKKLLFLGMLLVCFSCTERNSDGSIKIQQAYDKTMSSNPSLVVIDSCEYLTWGHGLTHKGNCKYCTERRKKEFHYMVDYLFDMQD